MAGEVRPGPKTGQVLVSCAEYAKDAKGPASCNVGEAGCEPASQAVGECKAPNDVDQRGPRTIRGQIRVKSGC